MEIDNTDWQLLEMLQENSRATFAELGREIAMSGPAVADRIRRLESGGVIRAWRLDVDLSLVGLPILALSRIRYPSGDYAPFQAALKVRPEVIECHHVTGDDCYVVKIAARSMQHLEEVTADLATFGSIATSVVYSTPIRSRMIRQETVAAEDHEHLADRSDETARRIQA